MTNALHHVAVAADGENPMLEQLRIVVTYDRRHVLGRYRNPNAIGKALAERTSGGLDAWGQMVFRMTRRQAAPLPEAFDLVEREIIAGEMKRRVQKHRAVSGR